jgi:Na+-translocating ferredoxin:NAD+ oxidoreductase RnfE subunit
MFPDRPLTSIVLGVAVVVFAIVLGCVAAFVVIGISNAILPPFRPEDDDTLRERIPVAITYLAGGVTTVIVLVAGWRWVSRRR